MRFAITLFLLTGIFLSQSCKKDSFITAPGATIYLSEDTLHFDTVFTSTGSTTQYFKIFNNNSQKIRLSNISLAGGTASFFRMNIDGTSGITLSDIDIEANDSLYGFVTVNIDPNAANLPFLVRDSIKIICNGDSSKLQLAAYGKNAYFLKSTHLTKDTTWNNHLPIVLLGNITVDANTKLTITEGTKIYAHANALLQINGTLTAFGNKYDSTRIVFTGDRLDAPYKNYSGSWPGIHFGNASTNNVMQYCIIQNSTQGAMVQNQPLNSNPKLTVNECIFTNISDTALGAFNSSIAARNCLISNSGFNVALSGGGNYQFNQCTIVAIDNFYVAHKNAAVSFSDGNNFNNLTNPLNCTFNNSIIYGESSLITDELSVAKQGSGSFNITLSNVLYKAGNVAYVTFSHCLQNQTPIFDSVDVGNKYYNFRLKSTSPCINQGRVTLGLLFDLDGNNRNVGLPDLGCYERQ